MGTLYTHKISGDTQTLADWMSDYRHEVEEKDRAAMTFEKWAGDCLIEQNRLVVIFEGITDSAASEYLEENTKSQEAIEQYAENGLGIYLTKEESQQLFDILQDYKKGEWTNQNEFYHKFIKPLEGESKNDNSRAN